MMTLQDIKAILGGELLTHGVSLEAECSKAFASDIMSDVLAFMDPGSLLLTGLVNTHVIRTARLADARAIIFVEGKRPDAAVVAEARLNNVPIIATGCSMFEACARISSLPGWDHP